MSEAVIVRAESTGSLDTINSATSSDSATTATSDTSGSTTLMESTNSTASADDKDHCDAESYPQTLAAVETELQPAVEAADTDTAAATPDYTPLVDTPPRLPGFCAKLSHLELYVLRDYCMDLRVEVKQARALLESYKRDRDNHFGDHAKLDLTIAQYTAEFVKLTAKHRNWETAYYFAMKYKRAWLASKGRAMFFPPVPTAEIRKSGFDQAWKK